MTLTRVTITMCVLLFLTGVVRGQTSSLGARARESADTGNMMVTFGESTSKLRNAVYEQFSWISKAPPPPKTFKVHDLISIIVRHRSQFEADSQLDTKKEWDIKSELDAFLKFTAGGVGAAAFRRGMPNISYKFSNDLKGDGQYEREDRFTTRVTAEVIDVKPNGNLVLEAVGQITFDEEVSTITITGLCRKDDVTPDNSVLSTQLADLNINVQNEGALRRASIRGWIPRIIDWVSPI